MMMKRIQYIALLAALLFSACISEEIPDNKQESKNIELLLSVPNYRVVATTKSATRATAAGTTAEQTVSNLYLFLFPTASGQSLVTHYIANTGDFTDGNWTGTKISLNMTQAEAGIRNVYIVANFDGGLKNKLDTVQTVAGLQNVFGSSDTPWSPTLGTLPTYGTRILMSGKKENHNFINERVLGLDPVGSAGANEPLHLIRALARIEFKVALQPEYRSVPVVNSEAQYKYRFVNFDKESYVLETTSKPGNRAILDWTPWSPSFVNDMGTSYAPVSGEVNTLNLVTYINETQAGSIIEISVPHKGTGPLPPPEFGDEVKRLPIPDEIKRNYWYEFDIEI